MIKFLMHLLQLLLFIIIIESSFSQTKPKYIVDGLDNPSPGYLLIGPLSKHYLSLYDNSGNPVFSKDISLYTNNPPNAMRILSTGNSAFFADGTWFIMDDNLNVIDQVKATSPYGTNFHTLRTSSHRHYLLAANDFITVNMKNKVPNGNPNTRVWNIIIQEFDSQKNLVFEWSCYDHIDVTDATEDISMVEAEIDPYHINSADYDWDGNIIANFRNLDAIIKIKRSTGEIMWIMGGSKSKLNQFTFTNDTKDGFTGFSHQHDPKRLPNGNILLFDNANLNPKNSSRAVEYSIDETSKTARKVWEYHYTPAIFSAFQGNAQRLPNGNTLIGWGCNSVGKLATEVRPDGKIVSDMSIGSNEYSYQVLRNVMMMNAVSRSLNSVRLYNFNEGANRTGISLNVSSISGSGTASVEKHDYSAYNLYFDSITACSYLPNRWVLNYHNITTLKAKIYFSLDDFQNIDNKSDLKIFWRESENKGSFKMLNTTYSQVSNRLEAEINNHGEFILGFIYNIPPSLELPQNNDQSIGLKTKLMWSSNSETNDFTCQIALDENFNSIVLDTVVFDKSQLNCNLSKNHTDYFWRVKGKNISCDKNWSDVYKFTTEIAKAELNLPVNGSTNQPLVIELTWNTVEGASNYIVQASEDSSFKTFFFSQDVGTSLSSTLEHLKPMTKYYWRILSGSNGTIINSSIIYSFKTTVGKVQLAMPLDQNLRTNTNVTLTWSSLKSVTKYRIQLSANSDFSSTVIDSIVNLKTQIQYPKLMNSTIYYWRVMGFIQDTITDWSDIWQFKTKIGKTFLKFPENESFGNKVASKFEWNSTPDAVSYQLQLSKDSSFRVISYSCIMDSSSQVYISNLNWNTCYYWRVMASDGKEYGEWSTFYRFYTTSEQLLPRNNEYKIPLKVNLEWNPTENIDYYNVKLYKDSIQSNDFELFSIIDTNNLQISDLSYNTSYYWSVNSMKSGKLSQWSEPFRFTTQLKPPTALAPISNMLINQNSIPLNFKWTESDGKEFYHLQISDDSTFSKILFDYSDIISEELNFNEILDDSIYYWRVSSFNFLNSSQWSPIHMFKIAPIVGIDENLNTQTQNAVNVYPNPINSEANFNFSLNRTEPVKLKILSNSGKELDVILDEQLQAGNYCYKWEPTNCNSGVYYYILYTGNKTISGKIIIIK